MRALALLLAVSFSAASYGADKAIPYLGPGLGQMSKEEYERVYKTYIQTSILLGYPLLQSSPQACDQALNTFFRQAGFFTYPVPGDATQVQHFDRKTGDSTVETYVLGGFLIQLKKNTVTAAPERLFWVNSGSTKATRRLVDIAKKDLLTLEKDKVTGLEKVKGIPVGYPHMFLGNEGQGLQVRILSFNGKKDRCQPTEYSDNAWSGGFDLSEDQCRGLQADVSKVWKNEASTSQFYGKELARMKDSAIKDSIARGNSPAEAKRVVEKYFVPPFASEINVVGAAMKNLAQCNLMALGRGQKTPPAGAAPAQGAQPTMDPGVPGAGSAR